MKSGKVFENSCCYGCGVTLRKKNSSKEHIIPNAIGGRLKSRKLLCKDCNSAFGSDIDFKLTQQLSFLCNLLNIKRDDGEVPKTIKPTDGDYNLRAGGKPVPKKPSIEEIDLDNGMRQISVHASPEQAESIFKGLQRKYNLSDELIAEAKASAQLREEYVSDSLNFPVEFGGSDAFRSICKTAVSFFVHRGGNPCAIQHLVPYIRGERDKHCTFFYYPVQSITKREPTEILHTIIVAGDETAGVLYAYIEYFSCYSCIVLLNDAYRGASFVETYFFDTLQSKEVNKSFNISISLDELNALLDNRQTSQQDIQRAFAMALGIALNKIKKATIHDIVEKTFDDSFETFPEGQIMDEEMFRLFLEKFQERFAPFLAAQMSTRDENFGEF